MPLTDDRTTHLNLPLPQEFNDLPDDVERLRQSFIALDARAASDDDLHDLFISEISALDGRDTALENRATTLETAKADLTSRMVAVEAKVAALQALTLREESQILADAQTVVNLAVLTSTVGAAVFVEGIRLKSTEWVPHATILTRLTLNTTYPAGYEVTVSRLQGGV
ncbi:hypothetical protein [Pseudomonas sp.]|uniref:hypothetical protein n=1 Tax=Pseudomonas sp. TaxID=306 RepID=UPI003FD84DF3